NKQKTNDRRDQCNRDHPGISVQSGSRRWGVQVVIPDSGCGHETIPLPCAYFQRLLKMLLATISPTWMAPMVRPTGFPTASLGRSAIISITPMYFGAGVKR